MKKSAFILCLIIILAGFSCNKSSKTVVVRNDTASIEFQNTEYDYGAIPYKGNGNHEFIFKNTGKTPLIIKNVISSCGCTVPVWPKEPIAVGDTGVIKVGYDTRNTGTFHKKISVYTNAGEDPIVLMIQGKVEAAEQNAATMPEAK